MATHVINPENQSIDTHTGHYPDAVNERFQRMMLVLVISFACITIVGLLTVFPGPKHKLQKKSKKELGL